MEFIGKAIGVVRRGWKWYCDRRDTVRCHLRGRLVDAKLTYRNARDAFAKFRGTPWSVRGVAHRDEANWRNFNRHRRAMSLSRLERELLFAGEHPVRYSLGLAALVASSWLLCLVLPKTLVVASWGTWQAAEHLSYFSTLWTVQATLAALVYPIVIAFVTVFLQRRPAAETFVHLYMLDSGALVAGLSSVTLVLMMGIQYVLLPTYGTESLLTWVALDAGWFLVNVALTTYFLFRTVEFLRPEIQQKVIRRYAVGVALPRDVMRLNAFQVLARSHVKGWIPVPRYLDESVEGGPRVWLNKSSFRDGKPQGMQRLREPVRLIDVRLQLLHLVVGTWRRTARTWTKPPSDAPRHRDGWPLLSVPMTPGATYTDAIPLAWVTAGPDLKPWQQSLLARSYVFRPIRRERLGIQVMSILQELEADARIAAGHPDVEAFERAYETLIGLHEILLGACLDKHEDGGIGSWAVLPNIHTFVGRPLHSEWADVYRSIFIAAIGSMARDTRPVRRLCHLAQHLHGDELQQSPVEVREGILQLQASLMFHLGNWWSQRVEEQGDMVHGQHLKVVLRPPLHRVYEEVVSTFVGGWENAGALVCAIPEHGETFDWSTAPSVGRLISSYLFETSRVLLAAVDRGDRTAAHWLADVLAKWWGRLEHEQSPWALYGKTSFLTIETLSREWSDVAAELSLSAQESPNAAQTKSLQRGVLLAAVKNYWTDTQILVLEVLLSWAGESAPEGQHQSLAVEVAAGMLQGTQWRGGGTQSDTLSEMSAADYLQAKVRQYADGSWRGGYVAKLNRFVDRIRDMERPDMVSSRTYTFSGANDVASLAQQQLELFAILSSADWGVGASLRSAVEGWMTTTYANVQVLRERVAEWLTHLEQRQAATSHVVDALLKATERTNDQRTGWARATAGLISLRDHIETERAALLASLPIAPSRLRDVSIAASSVGFSKTTGKFPLPLFARIEKTPLAQQARRLNLLSCRRGQYTEVEMDQHFFNEKEEWARTMADHVAISVLAEVLSSTSKREIRAEDAASFWAVLKQESELLTSQGEHPVLIVDNPTRPPWIWDWQNPGDGGSHPRPSDLTMTTLEGRGHRYLCHFNDIEVFSGPIPYGASILLARETFESVTFQDYGDGRCVDTDYSEREDTNALIDLHLNFSARVELGAHEQVALRYADAPKASMATAPSPPPQG